MAGSIAELCHRVEGRAELMDSGLGYLAEEISEECAGGAAWILPAAFSNM